MIEELFDDLVKINDAGEMVLSKKIRGLQSIKSDKVMAGLLSLSL